MAGARFASRACAIMKPAPGFRCVGVLIATAHYMAAAGVFSASIVRDGCPDSLFQDGFSAAVH